MRVITATQTSDFRLQDCKHERLRRALEFRPGHLAAVAQSGVLESVAQPSARPSRQVSGKSLVGGATVLLGLAASWFMMASVASVDFSQYDTDPSTPQIVRPAPVGENSASHRPS